MTNCELYISPLQGAENGRIVRIEARQGAVLLARIEVDLTGYAQAMMGLAAVPAHYSNVRERGPRKTLPLSNGELEDRKP